MNVIILQVLSVFAGILLAGIAGIWVGNKITENKCPKCGSVMNEWSSDSRKDWCPNCEKK